MSEYDSETVDLGLQLFFRVNNPQLEAIPFNLQDVIVDLAALGQIDVPLTRMPALRLFQASVGDWLQDGFYARIHKSVAVPRRSHP